MRSSDRRDAPRRRAVLFGALAAGTGAASTVAGCTGSRSGPVPTSSPTPTPPLPDEPAAGRAVLSARTLLAAEAGLGGGPRITAVARTVAASHRAHLAALGMPDGAASPNGSPAGAATGSPSSSATGSADGGATGSPSATLTGTGSASTAPAPALTPAAAVTRERAAASEALADVAITTPATAGLLARIAAARAVHGDLVSAAAGLATPGELPIPILVPPDAGSADPSGSETPSPSGPWAGAAPVSPGTSPATARGPSAISPSAGSPSSTADSLNGDAAAAVSALLAGEHAAVFAYGLITARAQPGQRSHARRSWEAHRAVRDALERQLVAAGRPPIAAEPAYDVGRPPTTAAELTALAARVEDGLAAVAFRAVTGTAGDVRMQAAGSLVHAARAAAAWRRTVTPLPGGAS